MAVESVMMTSLWRNHRRTEKVISERRDLVVYLPSLCLGGDSRKRVTMFQVFSVQIQTFEPHADVSELLFLLLLTDLPSVSRLRGPQSTYNRP
jgi:hypothetical protein